MDNEFYLFSQSALSIWRWAQVLEARAADAAAAGECPNEDESLLLSTLIGGRRTGVPEDYRPPTTKESIAAIAQRYALNYPLHIATSSEQARRPAPNIICHSFPSANIPDGFVTAGGNTHIASPELCFIAAADSLSPTQLIRRGNEMCGHFCIDRTAEYGQRFCRSLMTVESTISLAQTLFERGNCRQKGIARKALYALRYIADGLESPMEIVFFMLMCLPHNLGGFAVPKFLAGTEVTLSPEAATICGKQSLRMDLLLPGTMVDFECDGDSAHGLGRAEQDANRRSALAHQGYEVIPVRFWQLRDETEMRKLAQLAHNRIGKRFRTDAGSFREAHLTLRRDLLSNPGVGKRSDRTPCS